MVNAFTLNAGFFVLVAYKVFCILVGIYFINVGRKFFLKENRQSNGENITFFNIKINNGTPGTLFSLMGTAIVLYSIFKGIELEEGSKENETVVAADSTIINPAGHTIDTMIRISSAKLNIDSLLKLATRNINEGNPLEAYKLLYLTKGVLIQKGNSDSLLKIVNLSINEVRLDSKTEKKKVQTNYTTEEIRRYKVGDENIDTLK